MDEVLFRPAKLLIAIVDKHSDEYVVDAIRRGRARGGTKTLGRGMDQYFGGGEKAYEATEALIFALMYDEADSVIQELLRASLEDPEHIRGMALVIDAAAMIRPGSGVKNTQGAPGRPGSESMRADNILITCITTHGQADEIMSAARQSNAKGGTILSARGTGTEDDVKFFGISLTPEKEMLFIVAQNDQVQSILEAVCKLPFFSEPGGGIVYTTPVEEFFMLGQ